MTEASAQKLQQQARAFRDRFASVLLSTASSDGKPLASYAPYVLDDQEALCAYLSELAPHTRNLMTNPRVSLLFINEEHEARNPFARERLVLECRAEQVPEAESEPLLQKMSDRFGNTLDLLRSLPDFHLFRFQVKTGSYIQGFGKAWSLRGNRLAIEALRGR